MSRGAARCFSALIYTAAALLGFWLLRRVLLPWLAPFLLAFGLASLTEPPVAALCRLGLRRGPAAGLVTLTALGLLGLGLGWLSSRGLAAAGELAASLPQLLSALGERLAGLEERILRWAASVSGKPERLRPALDALLEGFSALPAALSQSLLGLVTGAARHGPDLLLFAVTAGLGTFFFSASRPRVTAFLLSQLPAPLRQRLEELKGDLKSSLGGWLRAQLILMAMTFFELLAAFWLLGVRGAAALAAVTALIDALPVFGTGVVLLPWAAAELLLGRLKLGLGLAIAWAVVSLLRSCTQAKLLGDQIGLDPLVSLLAIYTGWQAAGVWGALLFPVLFVTVQQLEERGLIRLWKSP